MRRSLTRVLVYGLAIAALAGVFLLYTKPTILVALAEQLWSCF
ncbi:MAG: hypothetical protein V4684_06985 [Pseudomonadota bacterium]